MSWQPAPNFAYAVKLGMTGVSVWALQINLNALGNKLALDGSFGPATDAAVKALQKQHGLTVDGVAGGVTDRAIVEQLATGPTNEFKLPAGLLKSIAANESGFIIPAYSPHPADPGFDLGPYQYAFPPLAQTEANYANAYSAQWAGAATGKTVRSAKDTFRKAKYVTTDKYAWQLAALDHNWPVAASNLANIGSINHVAAQDDQPASWIVAASGGHLSTPRQWVDHYIAAATIYVTSWPA